jgi:hypothetical protein
MDGRSEAGLVSGVGFGNSILPSQPGLPTAFLAVFSPVLSVATIVL